MPQDAGTSLHGMDLVKGVRVALIAIPLQKGTDYVLCYFVVQPNLWIERDRVDGKLLDIGRV